MHMGKGFGLQVLGFGPQATGFGRRASGAGRVAAHVTAQLRLQASGIPKHTPKRDARHLTPFLCRPIPQRVVEGFVHRADLHAGAKQLGGVHDTIGPWRLRSHTVELLVALPELKTAGRTKHRLQPLHHTPRRHPARVRHVVDPGRRPHLPQVKARLREVPTVRDRVQVVVHLRVPLHLA